MAGYAIKQIEDAILLKLSPLKVPGMLRTLKTYQGEMEKKDELENLIETIKGLTPAVFTIYAGSQIENVDRQIRETLFFGLIVIDESLRGTESARRGSTTNPGAYKIISDVNAILENNMIGLDIIPLERQSVDPLHFDTSIAVYTILYKTEQAYVKEITR
jgi:phage gp37-like protein